MQIANNGPLLAAGPFTSEPCHVNAKGAVNPVTKLVGSSTSLAARSCLGTQATSGTNAARP
jgi:hypothetical protein